MLDCIYFYELNIILKTITYRDKRISWFISNIICFDNISYFDITQQLRYNILLTLK